MEDPGDKSGQPRGIVRVYEAGGRYFARIERGLIPGEEGCKCSACTDERKEQPFIGPVIMNRPEPRTVGRIHAENTVGLDLVDRTRECGQAGDP